jgi:hypothetical protein
VEVPGDRLRLIQDEQVFRAERVLRGAEGAEAVMIQRDEET